MRWLLALAVVMACGVGGAAMLPRVEGQLLTGQSVVLPDLVRGKKVVLVAGFSRAGGKSVDAWRERLERDFGTGNVYAVAVLEGAPRLLRGMIVGSMKRGVPVGRQGRFLVLLQGEKLWKEALEFGSGDEAYAAMVDEQGNVIWRGHGMAADGAVAGLRAAGFR